MKITPQRYTAPVSFLRGLTTAISQRHLPACKMLPKSAGRARRPTPVPVPVMHSLKDEALSFDFLQLFCAIMKARAQRLCTADAAEMAGLKPVL